MRNRAAWRLVVLTLAGAVLVRPMAAAPVLDLGALLDQYAAGRFDEAIATIDKAGDDAANGLRADWPLGGRAWIDAEPSHRASRLLTAAALALEFENLAIERGRWGQFGSDCASICVLNWASSLLIERGAPDEAERIWRLAAIAMGQGTRDERFLAQPLDPRQPLASGRGATYDALARFPNDPRFRLDRALAMAMRYSVTTESGPRNLPAASASGRVPVIIGSRNLTEAFDIRSDVVSELTDLSSDPVLGVEAQLRLGYLHWTGGDDIAAAAALRLAGSRAEDADLKYLAYFLLGWTAMLRGDDAAAVRALTTALEARPDSQSATLALAALELKSGAAEQAYARAETSLAKRPTDDDPWRLMLYGHHPQLPSLIIQLRKLVHP